MKVMLLNGSPRGEKCTYTALSVIAKKLNTYGIETEIFNVGAKPISGCVACGTCVANGKCFMDDGVNEFVAKMAEADGLIVGSPVYYASASGQITSFLDRAFYSGSSKMTGKPAAAIVSCRRGGASAAFDQLNKYFTISGMPLASSQYWNSVHGAKPGQAEQDLEGMQTMRTLAHNMSFLMKSIELGKEKFGLPEKEKGQYTNFIR